MSLRVKSDKAKCKELGEFFHKQRPSLSVKLDTAGYSKQVCLYLALVMLMGFNKKDLLR
jgi:hypothetical protein